MSADAPGSRVKLATAGTLFVLTAAAGVAAMPLAVLARQAAGSNLIFHVSVVLMALVLGGVGLVVARHQPRNPVGWLLLGCGLCFVLATDASFYAILAYRLHPGRLPLGGAAVLLQSCWGLAFAFFGAAVLLFPDGRLPSRHWRWPLRIYLAVVSIGFGDWIVVTVMAIAGHHVRVDASGDLITANAQGAVVNNVFLVVLVGYLVAAVILQASGYRRAKGADGADGANGVRRQQLKWVASGAALAVVCGVAATALNNAPEPWQIVSDVLVAGIAALPVSMGIAILRYRLYDIDRIISRTLAYAIVTGLLVGLYAGLVLLATQVLTLKSPVAVAGSTLVAAAAFSPLRARVQHAVDRRFNRARYDADQTVSAFAARLKDAVDLESVRNDLATVVDQALEPVHLSVWISRPG